MHYWIWWRATKRWYSEYIQNSKKYFNIVIISTYLFIILLISHFSKKIQLPCLNMSFTGITRFFMQFLYLIMPSHCNEQTINSILIRSQSDVYSSTWLQNTISILIIYALNKMIKVLKNIKKYSFNLLINGIMLMLASKIKTNFYMLLFRIE